MKNRQNKRTINQKLCREKSFPLFPVRGYSVNFILISNDVLDDLYV